MGGHNVFVVRMWELLFKVSDQILTVVQERLSSQDSYGHYYRDIKGVFKGEAEGACPLWLQIMVITDGNIAYTLIDGMFFTVIGLYIHSVTG